MNYTEPELYPKELDDRAPSPTTPPCNVPSSSYESIPIQQSSLKRPLDEDDSDENEEDGHKTKYLVENEHTKVVASHYNSRKEKGLYERSKSRIFHMRNFNNWVKSMLIQEYLMKIKDSLKQGAPLRVLDMCCGKGGDLLKWEKGNITHLICTDIAEKSIEQCRERYNHIKGRNKFRKFTAEFFACDSTLVRYRERYHDPSIELNLVSCQFAFHYSFESLRQAECMMQNAAECLVPGGYFIGTIPDAYEIMKRQREAENETFGNDVYKISFQCDTSDVPLFGAKYDFNLEDVVDCPEFLVHFPTLVKLARRYGLQLEKKEMFADYYSQMYNSGRRLLEKMNALETYSTNSKNLSGNGESEYEHAVKFMNEKYSNNGQRKIGTLSKSEWEAITIYTVFAFKKVKKVWNADGKPEYDFSAPL